VDRSTVNMNNIHSFPF